MRHLGSLALSFISAPLIYVLVALGIAKSNTGFFGQATGHSNWTAVGIGVAAMLAAAALYAILVMTRLSPLGPVLAGLMFLGLWAYGLFSARTLPKLFTEKFLGQEALLAQPIPTGVVLLLSIPLFATILSPRRWRSTAQPAAATPPGGAYAGTPYGGAQYSAAPAYPTTPPVDPYAQPVGGDQSAGGYPASPAYPAAPTQVAYPGAPAAYPAAGAAYPGAPAQPAYPGAPAEAAAPTAAYPGAPAQPAYPGAPAQPAYPGAPAEAAAHPGAPAQPAYPGAPAYTPAPAQATYTAPPAAATYVTPPVEAPMQPPAQPAYPAAGLSPTPTFPAAATEAFSPSSLTPAPTSAPPAAAMPAAMPGASVHPATPYAAAAPETRLIDAPLTPPAAMPVASPHAAMPAAGDDATIAVSPGRSSTGDASSSGSSGLDTPPGGPIGRSQDGDDAATEAHMPAHSLDDMEHNPSASGDGESVADSNDMTVADRPLPWPHQSEARE